MEENWQHQFIKKHPVYWWAIQGIGNGLLFLVKVWSAVTILRAFGLL